MTMFEEETRRHWLLEPWGGNAELAGGQEDDPAASRGGGVDGALDGGGAVGGAGGVRTVLGDVEDGAGDGRQEHLAAPVAGEGKILDQLGGGEGNGGGRRLPIHRVEGAAPWVLAVRGGHRQPEPCEQAEQVSKQGWAGFGRHEAWESSHDGRVIASIRRRQAGSGVDPRGPQPGGDRW